LDPFGIDKIGGGAGQGVGPDGLPVHKIGAGLDDDGLIGEAGEGEAEAAGFAPALPGAICGGHSITVGKGGQPP